MDESSDDAFQAPRQPNGAAATTNTPHSDAVANILATTPDWRMQAGPSTAADAGLVRGQAVGQAADAGQFVGQAAGQAAYAGQVQAQAAAPAADAGQQFGAQAAAPGHQGQIVTPSQIGNLQLQAGIPNTGTTATTTTPTRTTAFAATTAVTSSNPAAIANQSRSRTRSFAAATDFGEAQFLLNHPYHAYPSLATATAGATTTAAGLLTPIPRIVITTPDQRIHAPDSPTLPRARQPAQRRPRRHDLLNRINELEARIRSMTAVAGRQEMANDALLVDNAMLVMRVGGLRERVGYLEGQVGRERAVREGWRGRARWAEGVLRVLEGWGGEDGEEGEGGGGMDCE